MHREEWLSDAVNILRPWFLEHNTSIPDKIHVSVGWPKRAGKSVGACYTSLASSDGVNQIFISPELDEPIEVLATLLHELVHASDNNLSGHKGEFARVAKAMGLEGKMTATHAGLTLCYALQSVWVKLGDYPHAKLDPTEASKPQTTRMLKIEAQCCGFIARASRKALALGMPSCACGNEMELS